MTRATPDRSLKPPASRSKLSGTVTLVQERRFPLVDEKRAAETAND
jgi:hypothetical protein